MQVGFPEIGHLYIKGLPERKGGIGSVEGVGQAADRVVVEEAADTTPPVIHSLTADPALLWPPNHKLVPVTLTATDTDGDDRADVREPLLPGWGVFDTHAMQSNLARGFDNWLYGAVGYSNFEGNVGGKDLRFGQGECSDGGCELAARAA